ncbi:MULTISPECIES: spherulation-specific family 4 protein [Streptomyces]|uniref:Spherulation-specific family 4 protein n=2 Tax=Streptomyces TaxID=1883 RepID=A0ABU2RS08_9ACTN|nr:MULTISPECIES: spherulation-specific family 4 protein [unclassified Streptomyces]MBK3595182.1 phage tail protein [Streptomyces sp. MBT51]MDT0431632.1 spherulation-specific family 4 protein [Streptomyces sp. DSM 41770]HBF82043.1 phage tail protein [Streptomyces sp.]
MPHLTSTGTELRAGGAEQVGVGVPGYAHPLLAPTEWAELNRPGTPLHWAVLNIDNGPGARPDPHCLEAAGRLRNARERALGDEGPLDAVRAAGGRLLGHLDLAFGSRPFKKLIADARSYLDWYQVGGFYLDRCPAGRPGLPAVRRLTSTLAALLDDHPGPSGGGRIVLGHGTHPYPGYAEAADQLVTFRGRWTDYRWSQVAEWTAAYRPSRFAHFVHGVPRTHLEEAMRIARWHGAGTIFFTDRHGTEGQTDPFAALPSYWDEFVSRIGPGISE